MKIKVATNNVTKNDCGTTYRYKRRDVLIPNVERRNQLTYNVR